MTKKKWYKLDNCGKIFPPIMDEYDPCVIRLSCELNEDIDKDLLQDALEITLKDFPTFNSVLKRGFFWYYIGEVDGMNKVTEETKAPCEYFYGILYRVNYFKKRINLEVNHALTDGGGAITFLKCLVANYLKAKHDINDVEEIDTASAEEKCEDAFKKYYKSFKKHVAHTSKSAYKIKGEEFEEYRIKIIEGEMSSGKMLEISKKHDCSLTIYLISLLIKSTLMQMTEREKKKPINVTVPVSLRKEFPTKTTRNFFCTMDVAYKSDGTDDVETIIKTIKPQFEEELKKENLYSKMSEMIFLENFFITRAVPRVLKDVVLRNSYKFTRNAQSFSVSNLGKVTMPKEYVEYINKFVFSTSTDCIQFNCISFEDKFVFSFSSHFVSTEIQKNFTRMLSEQGIEISIDTNEFEES